MAAIEGSVSGSGTSSYRAASNEQGGRSGCFIRLHRDSDRPKLAAAIAREVQRQGKAPKLLIQVNTGLEPQKAGVAPDEAGKFVAQCNREFGLSIGGLMCIPPLEEDPLPHFEMLAALRDRLGLTELSMGMSADFEIAIAAGATIVRVGTAIFGSR